jgi:hypothetical protein
MSTGFLNDVPLLTHYFKYASRWNVPLKMSIAFVATAILVACFLFNILVIRKKILGNIY